MAAPYAPQSLEASSTPVPQSSEAAFDPVPVVLDLVRRAEKGDEKAMEPLRELLRQHPEAADALGGNSAQHAIALLVLKTVGANPLKAEATHRKLELLREELVGPNPTILERLVVDRVVAMWLHLHHLEQDYVMKNPGDLRHLLGYQQALAAAQKRYFAAINELVHLRQRPQPMLQVNIANEQVNVAGQTVNMANEQVNVSPTGTG